MKNEERKRRGRRRRRRKRRKRRQRKKRKEMRRRRKRSIVMRDLNTACNRSKWVTFTFLSLQGLTLFFSLFVLHMRMVIKFLLNEKNG